MTETLTLDQNPSIADNIILQISCPDADGCFLADPYQVNNLTVYYVNRDFSNANYSSYDRTVYDTNIQTQLNAAIAESCVSPTSANLALVQQLTNSLNETAVTNTFYYTDTTSVLIVGTPNYPAWLSSDPDNAPLVHVTIDSNGNTQYGQFEYYWTPLGMREGDYFLCWTWSPNPSGGVLTDSMYFSLSGSTAITTAIPTHQTDPKKYPTLLERYLPEMFKKKISSNDLTPLVLRELQNSVGEGFTFLENLANSSLDLIDANAIPEAFLPLLGNLFNIKLRTSDPTLWRRQIKRAIPLAKMKGTYRGLKEALLQAGVNMTRFCKLWQIISSYTYQESFTYEGISSWTLEYVALAIDPDNFEVYYRPATISATWQTLNHTYVSLTQNTNSTTLNWLGEITLNTGDEVRVVYQIKNIPSGSQSIETYIRSLPLADQRDERSQVYPLKNWNVRVIEEDDPMFDLVIPTRNPFYDDVIYGKVRTEFAYSENIYNMEEYNGSTRDSYNPCDIDRYFVDNCSGGLGSKFVIDLEIEELTTNRILEVQEVIEDFVPFHAVLHAMNLTGTVNDFIKSPYEKIEFLVNMSGSEFTVSGDAQNIFNRSMLPNEQFKRNQLANVTTVVTNDTGNCYNPSIVLYCPDNRFDEIPLNKTQAYTYLEVLNPSANAGTYEVQNAFRNTVQLASSANEPLDQSAFTFRLSNQRAVQSSASIYQDNYCTLTDATESFNDVKTDWDVTYDVDYSGGAWQVTISGHTYTISNILPNGALVLDDPDRTLPGSSGAISSYLLMDDLNNPIFTSTNGQLTVLNRGRVNLGTTLSICGNTETLSDVRSLMDSYHGNGVNHYILYNTVQYPFLSFVDDSTNEIYIQNYVDGDMVGVPVVLYQRLLNNQQGYFNYQGLQLITNTNYETELNIQNGDNPPTVPLNNNCFYQNFLVVISGDYYAITRINGTTIWLAGPDQVWTTEGTSKTFDILQYIKQDVNVPARVYPYTPAGSFTDIDRSGGEAIIETIETADVSMMALAAMFNAGEDEVIDITNHRESISFSIKTRDGSGEQGEL